MKAAKGYIYFAEMTNNYWKIGRTSGPPKARIGALKEVARMYSKYEGIDLKVKQVFVFDSAYPPTTESIALHLLENNKRFFGKEYLIAERRQIEEVMEYLLENDNNCTWKEIAEGRMKE
jgi:hypothetical protein